VLAVSLGFVLKALLRRNPLGNCSKAQEVPCDHDDWMNCAVIAVIAAGVVLGNSTASIADEVLTYDLAPSCWAETIDTASDRGCVKMSKQYGTCW
jgi:hypothetical protein